MKLSTHEDIEAPIAYVFSRVSDFSGFERRAMRQGVAVSRRQEGEVCVGTFWDIAFSFRGRERQVIAQLVALDPPQMMRIDSQSDGLLAQTQVELVALSQTRTRVLVTFELSAKTLPARLLLQSLKLAKSKMTKRFKARAADYAETLEDDFRRGQ